jgi:FkbM family methyltransferase
MLSQSITLRLPYRLVSLPLIGKLQRARFRPRRRVGRRLIGKPMRFLHRMASKMNLGGDGFFTCLIDGTERPIRFNARNAQFVPMLDKMFEPEVAALIDIFLLDDGTFFDIGANWGYFTFYALSRPGFKGQVHAFEPYPSTHDDLNDIAAQTPFGARIVSHRIALSDSDANGAMGLIQDGTMSGLARIGGTRDIVAVQLRMLDSLALPLPSLLKIDVEDHETSVLTGARGVISKARPAIIFESWRNSETQETTRGPFNLLSGMDYRFFVPVLVGHDRLQLVETTIEQRLLMAPQLNILAYPAERMDTLSNTFGFR